MTAPASRTSRGVHLALLFAACVCVCCLGAPGCRRGASDQVEVDHSAQPFDAHECAACGMLVREQPAPRGQLVHRDGTRRHFCAIADMVTYLSAPSPHGQPVAIYVEVMDAAAEPRDMDVEPRPWRAAETVHYVQGNLHRQVMGEPVMTYEDETEAAAAATRFGAQVVGWEQLRDVLETE